MYINFFFLNCHRTFSHIVKPASFSVYLKQQPSCQAVITCFYGPYILKCLTCCLLCLKLSGDVTEYIISNVSLFDGERYRFTVIACNRAKLCKRSESPQHLVCNKNY